MSRVYADTVLPEDSGVSQDLTFGTTGDTVQVTSGASLNVNTLKDSGGNTLWTSDGSGTLSSFASGFQGNEVLIQTQTFTDQSAVAITGQISATYKLYRLQLIAMTLSQNGANWLYFNFSDDNGTTYDINKVTTYRYVQQELGSETYNMGYDAASDLDASDAGTVYQPFQLNVGNATGECLNGTLWLFDPYQTSYDKQFYTESIYYNHADKIQQSFVAGVLNNDSTVIDAMRWYPSSGTFSGTFKLYGIT